MVRAILPELQPSGLDKDLNHDGEIRLVQDYSATYPKVAISHHPGTAPNEGEPANGEPKCDANESNETRRSPKGREAHGDRVTIVPSVWQPRVCTVERYCAGQLDPKQAMIRMPGVTPRIRGRVTESVREPS